MNTVERVLKAMLHGTLFALILWGLFSLFGAPKFSHHHLTEVMFTTGYIYAFGHFSGSGS